VTNNGISVTSYSCLPFCLNISAFDYTSIKCCNTDLCNKGTAFDDISNSVEASVKLNLPLIVGVSVGGFCFLLIVAAIVISILVYCFFCKKNAKKTSLKNENSLDQKPQEISSITKNIPSSLSSKHVKNANSYKDKNTSERRYSLASSYTDSSSIYTDQAEVKIIIVHPYSMPRKLVM